MRYVKACGAERNRPKSPNLRLLISGSQVRILHGSPITSRGYEGRAIGALFSSNPSPTSKGNSRPAIYRRHAIPSLSDAAKIGSRRLRAAESGSARFDSGVSSALSLSKPSGIPASAPARCIATRAYSVRIRPFRIANPLSASPSACRGVATLTDRGPKRPLPELCNVAPRLF